MIEPRIPDSCADTDIVSSTASYHSGDDPELFRCSTDTRHNDMWPKEFKGYIVKGHISIGRKSKPYEISIGALLEKHPDIEMIEKNVPYYLGKGVIFYADSEFYPHDGKVYVKSPTKRLRGAHDARFGRPVSGGSPVIVKPGSDMEADLFNRHAGKASVRKRLDLTGSMVVMQRLHGKNLGDFLRDRPSFSDIYRTVSNLLERLLEFHKKGIHIDLKPDNVMVKPEEEEFDVRIIDYGTYASLEDVPQKHSWCKGTTGFLGYKYFFEGIADKETDVTAFIKIMQQCFNLKIYRYPKKGIRIAVCDLRSKCFPSVKSLHRIMDEKNSNVIFLKANNYWRMFIRNNDKQIGSLIVNVRFICSCLNLLAGTDGECKADVIPPKISELQHYVESAAFPPLLEEVSVEACVDQFIRRFKNDFSDSFFRRGGRKVLEKLVLFMKSTLAKPQLSEESLEKLQGLWIEINAKKELVSRKVRTYKGKRPSSETTPAVCKRVKGNRGVGFFEREPLIVWDSSKVNVEHISSIY